MPDEQTIIDEVIAANDARIAALIASDVETLDRYVGDDLVYISPTAKILRKPEVVAALRAGTMVIEKLEAHEPEVRVYADMAILICRSVSVIRDGDERIEGTTRSTAVYARREPGWQLVSQQQCFIP